MTHFFLFAQPNKNSFVFIYFYLRNLKNELKLHTANTQNIIAPC